MLLILLDFLSTPTFEYDLPSSKIASFSIFATGLNGDNILLTIVSISMNSLAHSGISEPLGIAIDLIQALPYSIWALYLSSYTSLPNSSTNLFHLSAPFFL